jgi:DMSO/TMAO reductase YedYZ molybdopterin-dependent catalytic subunit
MHAARLCALAGLTALGLSLTAPATALAQAGGQAAAASQDAADAVALTIVHGTTERGFSVAQLRALPATDLNLSFATEHGREQASWRGVPLWTLLARAGAIDPNRPRDHVRESVVVTGQDGYAAVLALGEIDPAFEGKQVLLAWQRDGAPLTAPHLRLAVPGDAHGGRSVRDVARIEVR